MLFVASASLDSKLNPLFNLTSIFLVSPILLNNIYLSFTSSLGILIVPTNLLFTVVSSPSSPFPLYPTVHTVPSVFTNVEWEPYWLTSIVSVNSFLPSASNTNFGNLVVDVVLFPNCP